MQLSQESSDLNRRRGRLWFTGLAAAIALAVAACGGGTPAAGEGDSSTTEATATTSTVAEPTPEPSDSTTTSAADGEAPSSTTTTEASVLPGPEDLEPDTAFVSVEGQNLVFAVGDEFANICELSPDFGFGDVKMHLIDSDFSGVPDLHVSLVAEPTFFVIQIGPDLGYIAGSGEYVDPIADYYNLTPPPVGLEVSDGFAVGEFPVVNVFTEEIVDLQFVIVCG